MSKRISRRFFLSAGGVGLAGLGLPAWADAPRTSLRPVARKGVQVASATVATKAQATGASVLVSEAQLGGHVAFAVADTKSGLVLEARESDLGQPPASVTKALTALYALDTLGAGHRFVTQLIATGPVENGVLKGDLVLAGGGDPTLDTNGLADLSAKLKSAGVREVSGAFKVWGGALPRLHEIDRSQPDHVGYNPAISGIALNYNRVHFEWKRGGNGWTTSMDARSNKYRPEVRVARMQVVNRTAPVYTYVEKGGVDHWTVASKALGKGGSRWLPVRQPEIYAGEVFRTFARSHGIVLDQPMVATARPGGRTLASRSSRELRVILRDMLKYSNNLTAEMVGLAASVKRKGGVANLKSSGAEMSRWASTGLGMSRARLVDHSGLGDASRLTAADMARALVKVYSADGLKPLLKPFAMRNSKGRVDKSHPIKVFAKTGTLNFVSGLAGYMRAPDGTELAFAIFAADGDTRARLSRAQRERPEGARGWNRRAKKLQQKLIERWGTLYGS